ncbi:SHOCT domain-containing protein [Cognatilysobacter lacus]|uniref:SHOCT domain-containing protein n=1 Tax=Cognatilysobacter lacus TaxID=1643323 RepID=A0A5D8YSI4_9GAMM|nr:SHOCT domain-containing protein [Lysobacter lacus]TZF85246.1 hypothetical protein FW784_12400 [Lysobacter lacus]
MIHSVLVVFTLIGGGVGYLLNDFIGFLVGAFAGAIIGGILGVAASSSAKSKPPEVRVAPDNSAAAVPTQSRSAARLLELDELKAKGLISEAEWSEKRNALLRDL